MPESKAQVRLAYAVLGGHARNKGMPAKVAKEITEKAKHMDMAHLPERKMPKGKM